MSAWVSIKAKARRVRHSADEKAGPGADLDAILAAALTAVEVEVEYVAPDDPLLAGGEARLDRESDDLPVVWVRNDSPPAWRRFLLAHELAHALLHTGSFVCGSEMVDPAQGEEDVPGSAGGYSARDRLERQANVWGREFLLPAPALRSIWQAGTTQAEVLAVELGLDERLVRRQAARALLTVEPPPPGPPKQPPVLRGAQQRAAEAEHGPLLVVAGPGTGKTTTLAARVAWLLGQGVEPEDITAVTFSRRAADEMRERVAAARPDLAERLRLDTLHSLALDILRRRGPWPDAEVVDEARAVGLVEGLIPKLGLRHLLYLPDPAARVRDALRGVRRAKDEGVGPDEFTRLALDELDAARAAYDAEHAQPQPRRSVLEKLDADVRRTERVEEAARVYRAYQARLRGLRRYDFGDLLVRAVELLRLDSVALRNEGGGHLLVDEVQDLNGTALALVQLLAGDGSGLWMVGDPHQAIYRFQGASAEGFRALAAGCRVVHLDQNRRSRREVVDVFQTFVPRMAAAPDPSVGWDATRGRGGAVTFRTAESPEAELAGLTQEVQALADSVPYREQAVLARKHTHLAEVAEALEANGVPVLFLSGLFERPVVRDLLAVLELASEPSGRALVRVAALPEYAVPREDVLALLRHAAERDVRFPAALAQADGALRLSEAGRSGLARLRAHVERIGYADHPWVALTDYLFNASAYLARLADGVTPGEPEDQRRRAAVFQLLQVAASYAPPRSAVDPKRAFLAYVRRLAASAEHRQLAQPPEWAAPIDAVRLLTVHAAKGLEFDAVHVPFLNEFDFHLWSGGERPLAPAAVIGTDDGHHAEEECVHFVAASRPRDVLSLSRSRVRRNAHGEIRPAKPTPLLRRASAAVPGDLDGEPEWTGAPVEPSPPDRTPLDDPPTVDVAELEAYADCPRRYAYERREGLAGHTEVTPYRRLVRIIRGLLRDATEARRRGAPPDEDGAVERWRTAWADESDDADPYHELFLREGEDRVRRAFALLDRKADPLDVELVWHRPKGSVRVEADLVLRDRRGRIRVQRWVAGAPSFYEKRRLTYAVLHGAAADRWGGRAVVEAVAVAAEEVEPVPPPPDGEDAVDRALDGLHRGDFPARPDPYRCPSCPFYFLCPS